MYFKHCAYQIIIIFVHISKEQSHHTNNQTNGQINYLFEFYHKKIKIDKQNIHCRYYEQEINSIWNIRFEIEEQQMCYFYYDLPFKIHFIQVMGQTQEFDLHRWYQLTDLKKKKVLFSYNRFSNDSFSAVNSFVFILYCRASSSTFSFSATLLLSAC